MKFENLKSESLTVEAIVERLMNEFDAVLFEYLIDRFNPLYKNVSHKYPIPSFELEDYIQEGRIIMHEVLSDFQQDLRVFSSYYRTSYKNRVYNIMRQHMTSRRGGGVQEISLTYYSNEADGEISLIDLIEEETFGSVQDIVEMRVLQEKFAAALSKLEVQVLVASMQSKTTAQTAQELGVSKKRVMNALGRCRTKLIQLTEGKELHAKRNDKVTLSESNIGMYRSKKR